MDIRTGEIAPLAEFEKRGVDRKYLRQVGGMSDPGQMKPIQLENLEPAVRASVEATGRGQVSRNGPCPCGSGKRFKRCCMFAGDTPRLSWKAAGG